MRVELYTSAFAFFLPPVSLGALSTLPSLSLRPPRHFLLHLPLSSFAQSRLHNGRSRQAQRLSSNGRLAETFSNDALTAMLASANKLAAARPQSASIDSDQAPAKVDSQMGRERIDRDDGRDEDSDRAPSLVGGRIVEV